MPYEQRPDVAAELHRFCFLPEFRLALLLLLLLAFQQPQLKQLQLPMLVKVQKLHFFFLGVPVIPANHFLALMQPSERQLVLAFQFFNFFLAEFQFDGGIKFWIERELRRELGFIARNVGSGRSSLPDLREEGGLSVLALLL